MAFGDIWSWENHADDSGSVISASPTGGASASLSLENLRDPRIGKFWRATSSTVTLSIALASPAAVDVVGLFGLSPEKITSLTLKLGTTPGGSQLLSKTFTTSDLALGMAVALPRDGADIPTTATAQYMTADIVGSGLPDVGRAWIGKAGFKPSIGHTMNGSSRSVVDYSSKMKTPRSGAVLVDAASKKRMFTAAYDMLDPTEYEMALADMDLSAGVSSQILFVPRADVYPLMTGPILGYLETLEATRFVGFLRGARTLSVLECG